MSITIHPTAIVAEGATIGDGCMIGPYCVIGASVTLGKDNFLHSHVVLDGRTRIGDGNEIYPFACLGMRTQDLKYKPEWVVYTEIGDGNIFREYTTVNAATIEGATTKVGNHGRFLSYSHIAHDCIIGDHVIISSDSKLAGHVEIQDHAIMNAKSGAIQFVRIGKYAFIGANNKVVKDILPFCIADGYPYSTIRAVNKIGLNRNGFEPERVAAIQKGFRTLIRSGLVLKEALAQLEAEFPNQPDVMEMVKFASESQLGLARPQSRSELPE